KKKGGGGGAGCRGWGWRAAATKEAEGSRRWPSDFREGKSSSRKTKTAVCYRTDRLALPACNPGPGCANGPNRPRNLESEGPSVTYERFKTLDAPPRRLVSVFPGALSFACKRHSRSWNGAAFAATRLPTVFREREINMAGHDKIFAGAWLSPSQIIMGTKAGRPERRDQIAATRFPVEGDVTGHQAGRGTVERDKSEELRFPVGYCGAPQPSFGSYASSVFPKKRCAVVADRLNGRNLWCMCATGS
ncbi:MAG: hypothetical protein BJ554DRAFT_2422, partial [Olpidium bornovanus]